MPVKVSVIIPCYNGGETLPMQLNALAAQQCHEAWEVVLVNNRSSDNSVSIAEQFLDRIPDLRIIDALDKQGQPYALNVGINAARGDKIMLCDADDMVGEGWLKAMVTALENYDVVAARFDIREINAPKVIKMRGSHLQETGLMIYDYPPYYPHVGGGSLGFKRYVWEAVNGFDDAFPALHDTDFCWKIQRMGKKIHFIKNAVVHIRYRDSRRGNFKQAKYYGEYNVKLYKKYQKLGMPKIEWKEGLKRWRRLLRIRQIISLRNPSHRALYFNQLGWQLGRLKGCIRYKTLAF